MIPHLSLPLRVQNGQFSVVEQDSDEEIIQCIGVICKTPQGARIEVPDFGVPQELFTMTGTNGITSAELKRQEQRVDTILNKSADEVDELLRNIEIGVG